jgi:hypothetical protein
MISSIDTQKYLQTRDITIDPTNTRSRSVPKAIESKQLDSTKRRLRQRTNPKSITYGRLRQRALPTLPDCRSRSVS